MKFGRFSFVLELPDIDWVPSRGFGVVVDLAVESWDQDEFLGRLLQLSQLGWLSEQSSWSIQQAATNWHGFGARSLCEALQGWKERYQGVEVHHTEELCYFDSFDDGWYTLTAGISARESRRVLTQAELSFQLIGMPLDTEPFREMCKAMGNKEPVYEPLSIVVDEISA
jgi:hypothetical protein